MSPEASSSKLGHRLDEHAIDVPSLPRDIFLMILGYLDFMDIVYCRRVSRSWHTTFSNPCNLSPLLKPTFPLAREVRGLCQGNLVKNYHSNAHSGDHWRIVFDQVAARYFHLSHGRPRSIERHKLWPNFTDSQYRQWCPVQPWDMHKSHALERIDFTFGYTLWTYEDGLLVFPSDRDRCILLLDLETNQKFRVPFTMDQKIIRRIRLQDRLLVVEWAECQVFLWLNEVDNVHRHFASSFDITESLEGWKVTFRNEWKIVFLGHPQSDRDRFFSSHNGAHYAIYAWKPNRSLYTADEDAPIESLSVWDISEHSAYRPSADPTAHNKSSHGPSMIASFGFRELDFYSVRQRGAPGIIRLDINSETGVIDITENTCITPNHPSSPLSWSSDAQVTSIPFIGQGPCWRRGAEFRFPPYRGNSSMQTPTVIPGCHWYMCVSAAVDQQAQVSFSLQRNSHIWRSDKMTLVLIVQTPLSFAVLDPSATPEIAFKGNICGDERFVVGENEREEIVILRFDR